MATSKLSDTLLLALKLMQVERAADKFVKAAENGHFEIVQALLAAGARLIQKINITVLF